MLVSTLHYAAVELKCCVAAQIVTRSEQLNPHIQHVSMGSFLPHAFFYHHQPVIKRGLRVHRPSGHGRGAVKASLKYLSPSPFHMLYLPPCQSDGEKIREVEAILQLRKIAEVRLILPISIRQLLLDYLQNWTHVLGLLGGGAAALKGQLLDTAGSFVLWEGQKWGKRCCLGQLKKLKSGPARLHLAEEYEKKWTHLDGGVLLITERPE